MSLIQANLICNNQTLLSPSVSCCGLAVSYYSAQQNATKAGMLEKKKKSLWWLTAFDFNEKSGDVLNTNKVGSANSKHSASKFVKSNKVQRCLPHGASKQAESKIAYFDKKRSHRYLFLFEHQLNEEEGTATHTTTLGAYVRMCICVCVCVG